jgi:hypothetical protein
VNKQKQEQTKNEKESKNQFKKKIKGQNFCFTPIFAEAYKRRLVILCDGECVYA